MRRVVIVCEGQTEEAFISRVLFPAFADAGLHLQGITVETSNAFASLPNRPTGSPSVGANRRCSIAAVIEIASSSSFTDAKGTLSKDHLR